MTTQFLLIALTALGLIAFRGAWSAWREGAVFFSALAVLGGLTSFFLAFAISGPLYMEPPGASKPQPAEAPAAVIVHKNCTCTCEEVP